MRLHLIIGLAVGLCVLIATVLLEGISLRLLLQPAALLLVFGGIAAALCIQFPFPSLVSACRALIFMTRENTENDSPRERMAYVLEMAHFVRTQGALALQPMLDHLPYPLLQRGAIGIVDNQAPEVLEDQLERELELTYRRRLETVKIFEAAGGYAPTMGMMGAIIGLARVVQEMQAGADIGSGVASAFVATLYGLGMANLLLLPLAGKLRQEARAAWVSDRILLEGILGIAREEHPMRIEEHLQSLITPEDTSHRSNETDSMLVGV